VILGYKYRSLYALAQPLSDLLTETWQRRSFPADVVVPIPLHPKRQRWRGFNKPLCSAKSWRSGQGSCLKKRP
jgi:predicted amidophosphoribosyltransferase